MKVLSSGVVLELLARGFQPMKKGNQVAKMTRVSECDGEGGGMNKSKSGIGKSVRILEPI